MEYLYIVKSAGSDDDEIEALSTESIVNVLIIGKKSIFTKLKKLNAIKLFKIKLDKYKGKNLKPIKQLNYTIK